MKIVNIFLWFHEILYLEYTNVVAKTYTDFSKRNKIACGWKRASNFSPFIDPTRKLCYVQYHLPNTLSMAPTLNKKTDMRVQDYFRKTEVEVGLRMNNFFLLLAAPIYAWLSFMLPAWLFFPDYLQTYLAVKLLTVIISFSSEHSFSLCVWSKGVCYFANYDGFFSVKLTPKFMEIRIERVELTTFLDDFFLSNASY